jgi:dihydroorotate dehydrogenase (fumarate)
MSDLSTQYLGLELTSPLVASSSPLTRNLSGLKQLEDVGASAVVLYSLFEEQFVRNAPVDPSRPWSALSDRAFEIDPEEFHSRPPEYLDLIRRAKETLDIPVIASLNAARPDRWIHQAELIEEAGADAIELDLYTVANDPSITSADIENRDVEILEVVKELVSIPVAIKLAPYFAGLAAFATRLDRSGADGLVLFNRFYQPTIDAEAMRIITAIDLSESRDSRLPMMWIAMLQGQIRADIGATGGVHTADDAIGMILAGADVAMLCSTLLRNGVERLTEIRTGMVDWLGRHGFASIEEIRGNMSLARNHDPSDYDRVGYAKVINRYW